MTTTTMNGTESGSSQLKDLVADNCPSIIQPTNDRVMIQHLPPEKRSKMGLILVPKEKVDGEESLLVGMVISGGPDCKIDNQTWVLFPPYAGQEMSIGDHKVTLAREEEVVATLEVGA